MQRITHLDGLRGLAIILVVLYHLFARWAELMPWGNATALPVLRTGYHGVELFFLISGFVILMTLERCNNIFVFGYKRWLRLFPAMLICSLIVFVSAQFLPERPRGVPEAMDLLPGLLFIDPNILNKFSPVEFTNLEGVFWSLYVEVKFYAFAAAVFYLCRRNTTIVIAALGAAFALSWFGIGGILAFEHYGWFAAGACFYLASKHGKWAQQSLSYLVGIAFAFASIATSMQNPESALTLLFLIYVFALSLTSLKLQAFLSKKWLVWFGFISYPLYLVHENLMIGLIVKYGVWAAAPALALVIAIAWLISKYAEPMLQNGIKSINKALAFRPAGAVL